MAGLFLRPGGRIRAAARACAALWLCALPRSAHAAASEDVLRALGSGFGKISPLGLALCGFGLIALMALLVVLEVLRNDSRQREKVDIGWQYFAEMAAAKRLSAAETDLLRRMVELGDIGSADMVFDSSFIYEDVLESFLKANASKLEKDATLYAQLRGLRVKLGYAQLPAEVPISSTRQFEVGSLISLIDNEGQARKGRVLEVNEKQWLVAMDAEIPPTIGAGGAVDFSLLRAGDGEYAGRLSVAGTRLTNRTLFLPHTRALERKQMRNWVRIDVNIPCRVTVTAKPDPASPSEDGSPADPARQAFRGDDFKGPGVGMVLEGRLLDLSGGGVCARFTSPIPQGFKLSLNFDLPGTSLRGIRSEVMRMSAVARAGREDYEHNLKFLAIETASQEKIVRYVFEKQRIDSQTRGPIKTE